MNCEVFKSQLDAYVDGGLSDADTRAMDQHCASCAACAEELRVLRAILGNAAALPKEIPPSRDLWVDIAPRLRASRAPARRARIRIVGWRTAALLTAAALVAVVRLAQMAGPVPSSGNAVPNGWTAQVEAADRVYTDAKRSSMEVLAEYGPDLDEGTRRVIEDNLRIIEQAMKEIRAALAADPGNAWLLKRLTGLERDSLGLIGRAARIAVKS